MCVCLNCLDLAWSLPIGATRYALRTTQRKNSQCRNLKSKMGRSPLQNDDVHVVKTYLRDGHSRMCIVAFRVRDQNLETFDLLHVFKNSIFYDSLLCNLMYCTCQTTRRFDWHVHVRPSLNWFGRSLIRYSLWPWSSFTDQMERGVKSEWITDTLWSRWFSMCWFVRPTNSLNSVEHPAPTLCRKLNTGRVFKPVRK